MENTLVKMPEQSGEVESDAMPTPEPKELGKNFKDAVSRCHFSTVIYLIVASVLASICSVGYSIVSEILAGDYGYDILGENSLIYAIFVWSVQILCMYVLSYPIFHSLTKHLPRRDKSEKVRLGFFEFIGIFIATEGVMLLGSILANVVNTLINEYLGITVEDTTSELIMNSPLWLVILVVVIIGPIFEELIFRKTYVDAIGKYSSSLAIFISGASFALFHGNITQVIYTFGAGLMLAWVYTKTKNIIYPIIMHMLLNFFGSIPSMLIMDSYNKVGSMSDEELLAGLEDPALASDIMKVLGVSLMQYGFIIIGIILLISMLVRGKFKLDRSGEVRLPFGYKVRGLVFNRGTLLFLIYSAVTILSNLFITYLYQM